MESFKDNDFSKYLGHQMALSNGHNGIYTCNEFRILEILFYNAKITTLDDIRDNIKNCNCTICK
jgi:hypothetical protein